MKVRDGALDGARPGTSDRPRRIPSERSDIAMLTAALRILCDEILDEIGPPGSGYYSPLRRAIWTARHAAIRATANRDRRDERKRRKAARERKAVA